MFILNQFNNKEIIIENFGPIDHCKVDLQKYIYVLIGAQASGKSTLCKVIYFCRKIKDYFIEFFLDYQKFNLLNPNEYFNSFNKFLRTKFIGCFGTTKHMDKFMIKYVFDDAWISIILDEKGFVRFRYKNTLYHDMYGLMHSYIDSMKKLTDNEKKSYQMDFMDSIYATSRIQSKLKTAVTHLFCDDKDIIYIPAGRSLLSTLSEQLNNLSVAEIDLVMGEFINTIRATKSKFGSKIPEMVQNYTKMVNGQVNNHALEYAYKLIQDILKADYVSDIDGEKMYFDEKRWVKLMYGSSVQQESLWILLILFSIILEKRKAFVVIEEPEAHLFPMSQKAIVELIALFTNVTESQTIITTHSPYILTSLNLLIYSSKVENAKKYREESSVIPKMVRVTSQKYDAFYLPSEENNWMEKLTSIKDKETGLIDTEFIDKVSDVTNTALEKLIELEIKYDL